MSRRYTYGLDLISQSRWTGSAWDTHFYLTDGLGSTRALLNTSGAVSDTYTYDAYGTLIVSSGSTPNDYRFTGEQWDATIGQHYLRARTMHPGYGRLWTMDTFQGNQSDPLSLHKYLYAQANPVNRLDPSGLDSYLLFWGDEDGVPFEEAAETKRDEIEAQPSFDRAKDIAKIISVRKFADVGDALKQYKDIKEIYFFVHHSPDVMHLDQVSTAPDSNVSKDGATYKKLTSYIPWRKETYLTTAFTGWDKSNCKSGWQLFIYGCHSKSLAKTMGVYLFGNEGQGIGTTCYFPQDAEGRVHPVGKLGYYGPIIMNGYTDAYRSAIQFGPIY